jgi:aspartyl-tRNA(Asn)/glutamyl-tRNA(Gln) amidotransferase subunit A
VKDALDTAGVLTQRGSPIFKGHVPTTDATAVARMKAAGAILLAKTNVPEFAYWTETDNLLTGRTNNPWNLERTPGGSSGGESAAIAAGLSPLGLGSDVAISLRGPAAHTGIVAIKATHGRIPATGHWPKVPRRFWHVGPMARSVRDVALAYSLLAGPDGVDGYATSPLTLDAGVGAQSDRPIRVGVLVEPGFGLVDADVAATVQAAASALAQFGVIVEPVRIPVLEQVDALDVFWKLQEMESKPEFFKATAGHEDQIFKYVQAVYDTPDTSIRDFVEAEQQAERLRDGFAAFPTVRRAAVSGHDGARACARRDRTCDRWSDGPGSTCYAGDRSVQRDRVAGVVATVWEQPGGIADRGTVGLTVASGVHDTAPCSVARNCQPGSGFSSQAVCPYWQ